MKIDVLTFKPVPLVPVISSLHQTSPFLLQNCLPHNRFYPDFIEPKSEVSDLFSDGKILSSIQTSNVVGGKKGKNWRVENGQMLLL
jgi:hypothetical protein